MTKYFAFLFAVSFVCLSCENNNEQELYKDFSGYYQIMSMDSSVALDLNNDGIATTNLIDEFGTQCRNNNEATGPSLSFDRQISFALVNPFIDRNDHGPYYITLRFPRQELSYKTNSNGQYEVLIYNVNSVLCEYQLNDSGNLTWSDVTNKMNDFGGKPIEVVSIKRVDNLRFECTYKTELFDMHLQQWKETSITVQYKREAKTNTEWVSKFPI